jgi:hypothetical protein
LEILFKLGRNESAERARLIMELAMEAGLLGDDECRVEVWPDSRVGEIALQAVRYQEEKRRAGVVVSTKEAVDAVMGCEL